MDELSLGESLLIARVLLVVLAILAAAVLTLTHRKRDVLRGDYVAQDEHAGDEQLEPEAASPGH